MVFADDTALMVADICADSKVSLCYQGSSGMLGQRPFFLAVEGKASLVRDKSLFVEHWTKGDMQRAHRRIVPPPCCHFRPRRSVRAWALLTKQASAMPDASG